MRDTGIQHNGLLLYERLGQQVMRLGLSPRKSFHAVSAIVGYVVGIAADLTQGPREIADGEVDPGEFLAAFADRWRALDPEAFPFVHYIVEEFAVHDDRDQFRAGLDLLLAGLRLQAGR
jgi:hypothetical protein